MHLAELPRMEGLILLALVLPAALTAALRRTRGFWLPGIGLMALGLIAFAAESDAGGSAAMGNSVLDLAGLVGLGYGFVCLVAGAIGNLRWTAKTADPPPAAELPRARVVTDVSDR
jgi:hypothetical protein